MAPPFRADHVGSFLRPARLRPARLRAAREKFFAREIDAPALRAVKDDCIREVITAPGHDDHRPSVPGNFKSAGVAQGGYEQVAEILLNEMKIDGFFLEYDDERSGDFAPLRFTPKGVTVVLGLMSSKHAEAETKDAVKRRIDEAAAYVALDQ